MKNKEVGKIEREIQPFRNQAAVRNVRFQFEQVDFQIFQ